MISDIDVTVIDVSSKAYQANTLSKGHREGTDDFHSWIEPLSPLVIAIRGLVYPLDFPPKES